MIRSPKKSLGGITQSRAFRTTSAGDTRSRLQATETNRTYFGPPTVSSVAVSGPKQGTPGANYARSVAGTRVSP